MIITNISFPKDLYMELKYEAAERRKSLSSIVRERIMKKNVQTTTQASLKKRITLWRKKTPKLILPKKQNSFQFIRNLRDQ